MTGNNRPVKTYPGCGGVRVALWENEIHVNGVAKTILKASVDRRYKDKSGEWRSSSSFDRQQVPIVVRLLERAYDAMIDEASGSSSNGNGVAEEVVSE